MLLNRRGMLSTSVGAIALMLSGCKKTKTTVVIVNDDPAKVIDVTVTAGGSTVTVTKLGVGKSSKPFVFRANGKAGTVVAATGSVAINTTPVAHAPFFGGAVSVTLAPFTITVGFTNTLKVNSLGAVVNTVT